MALANAPWRIDANAIAVLAHAHAATTQTEQAKVKYKDTYAYILTSRKHVITIALAACKLKARHTAADCSDFYFVFKKVISGA